MRAVSDIGLRTTCGWEVSCAECCRVALFIAGYHKVSVPWRCHECPKKEGSMDTSEKEARGDLLTEMIVRLQQRALRHASEAKRTGDWSAFNRATVAIDELKAERGPLEVTRP